MKVKPDPDAKDLHPQMEWITRQLYRLGAPKVSWNLGSSLSVEYLTDWLHYSNLEPQTTRNNLVFPNKHLFVVGVLHHNKEPTAYLLILGGSRNYHSHAFL